MHPNSQAIIATVRTDKPLRYNTDMGFVLVPPSQMRIAVKMVEYPDESNKGVQADEILGFVGCKERTKNIKGYGDEVGDAWCFVGITRKTKLILAYHLGKRGVEDIRPAISGVRSLITRERTRGS